MTLSAFVYPGQGSQKVGMLREHIEKFPLVKQTLTQASECLAYDLISLITEGPKAQLDNTLYTQPALLAVSISLWRLSELVWQQGHGKAPTLLAGHSLGEYSALVAAGALSFDKALLLVQERARCMQTAVPEGVGAMAAVLGLSDDLVAKACQEARAEQTLQPVNYNSPGQVVVAGNKEAVERLGPIAKTLGAKRVLPLPVSVPSHCDLMKPAAEQFDKVLNNVRITSPKIPVLHNVDAQMHTHPDDIRTVLSQQLYSPVQWTRTVEHLQGEGVEEYVECGPGKVLLGLIKRVAAGAKLTALDDVSAFEANER